jgi:hypothetical protein
MLVRLFKTGFVLLISFSSLSGCATPYQHNALTGGYTSARVDANTYRVRFKGNNYTSQEKVEHYLLYRCAEITDQLGYDHFVMVSQDTIDISDLLAQAARVPNYHGTALIRMFHQPDHPAALNAKEIMRQIATRYPEDFRS